jgi:hypothetical protein
VSTPPLLINCRFSGNRAVRSVGGGLYDNGNGTVLWNCLFVGNAAADGGGLYTTGSGALLTNCTLAHNRGGLGGAVADEADDTALAGCIVWGNKDGQISGAAWVTWCDIQDGWPEGNNLDVDPLFAAPGHWDPNGTPDDASDDVWIDGDYHLKSQGGRWDPVSGSWVQDDVTSPCIDAGSPKYNPPNEPAPNGSVVNLGVYADTIEASKTYVADSP